MGAAAVAAADALGCARPGLGSGVDGYQVTTPVGAVSVALSPHALRASATPTTASIAVDRNPITASVVLLERTSADRANHTTAAPMSVAVMVRHGVRDQVAMGEEADAPEPDQHDQDHRSARLTGS